MTCENGKDTSLEKVCSSQDSILLSPFQYISQVPGKNIRTKLAKAFNFWLQIPEDKLDQISEIVQMLHNASLMIDDIEDSSILRRGLPVTHNIYGTPQTINSANYVYFLALDKVLKLNHPNAVTIYTQQMLQLHRGQGMELFWRDSIVCPSKNEYFDMVAKKTGGLFGLAIGLMQLFSDNKSDLFPLIRSIGLHFQIRDDYANLICKEYHENKTFAEDLTEGKFSFPIIYAIKNSEKSSQILNILRQKTTEFEVKKYCVKLLENCGAFEFTKKVLKDLENEALSQIEGFGGNELMAEIIQQMKLVYS